MRFAKTCFISEGSYNAVRSSPIIEYILQILGRYNQFYVSSLHIIVVVFIVLKFSKFSKHFLSTSTPISLSSIIGQKCWFFPYQFKNFGKIVFEYIIYMAYITEGIFTNPMCRIFWLPEFISVISSNNMKGLNIFRLNIFQKVFLS